MNTSRLNNIKNKSLVLICKNLPGDSTILEENGFCKQETPICKYYETPSTICKKKTYTLIKPSYIIL